jgi:transposase InsO family protein
VEPCTDNIDADQLAEILIRRVFTQYGLPKKMISDRGPQYSSKVMKTVLKAMGVRSALSTAYHPQTDGASERANQSIEQYLRVLRA